jgi:hypothetical protein
LRPTLAPETLARKTPPRDRNPTVTTPTSAPPAAPPAGGPARRRSALLRSLPAAPEAPAGGLLAWLGVATSTWILVGLYLDGWSHIHRDGADAETFFTGWHALLYSGVAAAVAVHAWDVRRTRGLRPGYGGTLAGGLVVLAAGFVDMVWHTLLGVEADLDALLSPPHLLLITAGTLVFAGPVRAALRGGDVALPTAFSAAFVVTGLAFFTQYANPFTHLYPVRGYTPVDGGSVSAAAVNAGLGEVAGVAGVVVFAAMIGGAVAVLRSLGRLPAGALLVAVAVPPLFLTTLRDTLVLVPAALLAGLLVELAGRRLPPAPLAALACTLLIGGWAATLLLTRDVGWSLAALGGAVGSAAAAGYLTGWLVGVGSTAAVRERPAG